MICWKRLEKMGHHFPAQMLERCLHVLKHRGPAPLLRMSQRLSPELTELASVREHLGYLRKREGLMQYPQFRRQGWPIGSGMVESANKLVVEARLKGAGMHWERSHVNPLLALRNGVCNQRVARDVAPGSCAPTRSARSMPHHSGRATQAGEALLCQSLARRIPYSRLPPCTYAEGSCSRSSYACSYAAWLLPSISVSSLEKRPCLHSKGGCKNVGHTLRRRVGFKVLHERERW